MPETEASPEKVEARQTSGLTSRLILAYLEREGGREAVEATLALCGLTDWEEQLRDENYWFDYETKIRLFEAAGQVLDDADAARHIGMAGPELNVAAGLKLALQAFGSPKLVYANVTRASGKFTWSHRWETLKLEATHARLRYFDVAGVGHHPIDCQYNEGLLACIPELFGLPPARVNHDICVLKGADSCIYDIRWQLGATGSGPSGAAWAAASAAALGASALAAPALLPAAAAVPAVGAVVLGRRALVTRRQRWRTLEAQVGDQREVAERLTASLRDLVSGLRLHEVLDKITDNAQNAVGGKEFALLVRSKDGGIYALSSSGIPARSLRSLTSWAAERPELFQAPVSVDDLSAMPGLAGLPEDERMPLGSLCSAPLIFKDEPLGVLVALANGPEVFLPRDTALLESYAAQAAIALSNARMVERLERLARRDPLTGMRNHREFHQAVEREIQRGRKSGGLFSVVILDVDGFKRVNDEFGHAEGDRVLRRVADEIGAACPQEDAGHRIGGDEFALLLPGLTSDEATAIAQSAQGRVEALEAGVRVSFGVGEWPADGPTKDMLLLRADMAMYAAKPSRLGLEGHADVPAEGDPARERAERTVAQILAVGREQLDMDVAFMTELAAGREIVRALEGEGEPFELAPGAELEPEPSSDAGAGASREPVLHTGAGNQSERPCVSGAAACITVPLRFSDGRFYGTLGCASRSPRASLGARDLRFLEVLGRLLVDGFERQQLELGNRRLQSEVTGVHALVAALEARDHYTGEHSESVVELSTIVARQLGLSKCEAAQVEQVALLHDIGKMGVPDSILQKSGPLTEEEWLAMRQHPVIGAGIVRSIESLGHLAPAIRAEHERWDGRGYPDGLAAQDIPIASRIVFACDAYHAMTSDRPYRGAMSPREALEEIKRNAGSQFDPVVATALIRLLEPGTEGSVDGGPGGDVVAVK